MYDPFLNKEVEKIDVVECPLCGGQLHLDGEKGVCAACGKPSTIPKKDVAEPKRKFVRKRKEEGDEVA